MKSPKAPPVKRGPTNPGAVGMRHAGDGSGHAPRAYARVSLVVESLNPVDIMGLTSRSCRAVVDEDAGLFCNNPIDRKSFCAGHCRIVYMPPQSHKRADRNSEFFARTA